MVSCFFLVPGVIVLDWLYSSMTAGPVHDMSEGIEFN